ELPQASGVQCGDRVEDPVAFPFAAVMLKEGPDLPLRLGPGDQAGLAAAGAGECPQESDGLVKGRDATPAIDAQLGEDALQTVRGQVVADPHREAEAAQQSADCRLTAAELAGGQWLP